MQATWTAQVYYRAFDVSKMIKQPYDFAELHSDNKTEQQAIPESFDSREAWPKCKPSVVDFDIEATTDWSFAAAMTFSHRNCLLQTGIYQYHSPFYLQACADTSNLKHTFDLIVKTGITHFKCISALTSICPKECTSKTVPFLLYKAKSYSRVRLLFQMCQQIFESGALAARMSVYEDFLTYKSGIYQHELGKLIGQVSVTIVGYGEENGVKFWICQNNWGSEWGEKGYFRILKGGNECDIEDDVIAIQF